MVHNYILDIECLCLCGAAGRCEHQQVSTHAWKGHLSPLRTVTKHQQEEKSLYTLQRFCPHLVSSS